MTIEELESILFFENFFIKSNCDDINEIIDGDKICTISKYISTDDFLILKVCDYPSGKKYLEFYIDNQFSLFELEKLSYDLLFNIFRSFEMNIDKLWIERAIRNYKIKKLLYEIQS